LNFLFGHNMTTWRRCDVIHPCFIPPDLHDERKKKGEGERRKEKEREERREKRKHEELTKKN
jgi:hypothetical protein